MGIMCSHRNVKVYNKILMLYVLAFALTAFTQTHNLIFIYERFQG